MDLICEYSEWVLNSDEMEGLKIFTRESVDSPQAADEQLSAQTPLARLDQRRVLDHLTSVKPSCVRPYVEHVVTVCGDTSPELHDTLVNLFLEDLQNADAG